MALGASSAASAGAGGAHTYGKMEIESTVDRAAKGDTISEMINGEASPLPDADEATFVVRVLRNAYSVILTVMTFAVSISLLNITKWIYVTYNYRFPLFLTATHMVGSYIFAFFAIHIFKLCPDRRILSLKEQIYTVAPFSLMGAASIACGNMALVHLYPSFHEMLQNSTPIWTVLAAVILQRKQYNWMTWVSMIPVCAGGALCAYGEQSTFLYIGLVFSIMACVFRSVRAIVQGELLQGQEKIDSITLLYYAAPFNLALFLGGSFYLEGLEPWVNWVEYLEPRGKMWVFLGAGAAAMYNLLAYLMVGHMGAVATMVVNNLKTPSIIVLSTMIFGIIFGWIFVWL